MLAQIDKSRVKPQTTSTIAANTWRDRLDHREALVAEAAERGAAVPDLGRYDTWRDVTDFAVGRCEELMDDPGELRYSPRLHRTRAREPWLSVRAGARTCLKTTTGTSR